MKAFITNPLTIFVNSLYYFNFAFSLNIMSGPGASYEEPKIKAIDIAALLQEKYAFLSGK